MNRKNYLYSSGEFAKLTGVNKRTLHYYNEIGLFRPEIIGENGYHYYTCFQFTELELILTLRKIERCTLPERKIIFSSPISGEYDEDDFSIAAEFSLRLKKLFHLYDNFGSCISIEDIQKNSFNSYHSFFAYCPQTSDVYDEILPAGTYLRAFCIGDWGKLPEIYRSILYYARKHNLTLTGYAYEEGLNEMSIKDRSDYITMITIKCD